MCRSRAGAADAVALRPGLSAALAPGDSPCADTNSKYDFVVTPDLFQPAGLNLPRFMRQIHRNGLGFRRKIKRLSCHAPLGVGGKSAPGCYGPLRLQSAPDAVGVGAKRLGLPRTPRQTNRAGWEKSFGALDEKRFSIDLEAGEWAGPESTCPRGIVIKFYRRMKIGEIASFWKHCIAHGRPINVCAPCAPVRYADFTPERS